MKTLLTSNSRLVRRAGFGSLAILALLASESFAAPGALDTGFGTGGKVITDFPSGAARALGMSLQTNGRILAAGEASNGSDNDFAVTRYLPNGKPDTTFNTNGRVVTSFNPSSDEYAVAVGLQSDGKIVVVGTAFVVSDKDFAIARYLPTGGLDNTFSGDGKLTHSLTVNDDLANGMLVQPDDNILIVGLAWFGATRNNDFLLTRYLGDGSGIDPNFRGGTFAALDFGSQNDMANAAALQSDKKIVVVGETWDTSDGMFAIARLKVNGTLDPSFGGSLTGKNTTDFGPGEDKAFSLAILPGGKILVAGAASSPSAPFDLDFALARYKSDGTLDTDFGGGDGKVTTDFDGKHDRGYSILVQPDGKILVAGTSENIGANDRFAVARYHANGSPDPTFGNGGRVTTPIAGANDTAWAAAFQPDGRIVLVGTSGNDFALARYLARYKSGIPRRPDNHIGPTRNRQKGNNRYNLSGAGQTIRLSSKRSRKVGFFFTVQNDAIVTDIIKVNAPRKNRKYRTTYRRIPGGNVTGAIMRHGYKTQALAPGAKTAFSARIKPKAGAKGSRKFGFTSSSRYELSKRDKVAATLRVRR